MVDDDDAAALGLLTTVPELDEMLVSYLGTYSVLYVKTPQPQATSTTF